MRIEEPAEGEGDFEFPMPDRGITNPFWVFRLLSMVLKPEHMRTGLYLLGKHLEEADEGEVFHRVELMDIFAQLAASGDYVDPYEWSYGSDEAEEPKDKITEVDVETFMKALGIDEEETEDGSN